MAETERYQLSSDEAERYEQYTVPSLMRPHTEAMLSKALLGEGEDVLDVACGTGVVTRVAVERFRNIGSIVGVDLNPAMLVIARAQTPATHIPVEWREGDMCQLPFADARFDVVTCQQGIQYTPDKVTALRDMARVLVPGGRLILSVWSTPLPFNAALGEALTHRVTGAAGEKVLAPFAFRDPNAIRQSVTDAGFRDMGMQVIESPTYFSSAGSVREAIEMTTSRSSFGPFARAIAAVLAELEQDVSAALHAFRVGDGFVMPARAYLVEARVA